MSSEKRQNAVPPQPDDVMMSMVDTGREVFRIEAGESVSDALTILSEVDWPSIGEMGVGASWGLIGALARRVKDLEARLDAK